MFDEHVRKCAEKHKKDLIEPFFELRVFFVLKRFSQLLDYENMIHEAGHDTMNNPKRKYDTVTATSSPIIPVTTTTR